MRILKNKIILLIFTLFFSMMFGGTGAPGTGYGESIPTGGGTGGAPGTGFGPSRPGTPIDTNQIILIIVAVLLTAGVVLYRKLSVKKVS